MIKKLRRKIKDFLFKRKYGCGYIEICNLNTAIAKFVLPRLKLFRQSCGTSTPRGLTPKKWENIVDKMIFAFEYEAIQYADTFSDKHFTDKDIKNIQKGFGLFGKYFMDLWD